MKKIWVLFFAVKAIFIIGFLWGVSASAAPILSYGAYSGLKVFVSAQSFTYSENMPIEAFDNKFEGDFPNDGNYALTYNRYGAGIGFAGIELGFFERKDYFFRTVSDTFDLVYMDQNDIDFPINQLFYVYLHVQAVEASGVNFGYRFKPAPELELYVGGTYFESQDALYGSMAGTILDDGSRPRGDLIVDYIYTEEYLLDRPLTPPASGYGYGFDVLMAWQALPNVAASSILMPRESPAIKPPVQASPHPVVSTTSTLNAGTLKRKPSLFFIKLPRAPILRTTCLAPAFRKKSQSSSRSVKPVII